MRHAWRKICNKCTTAAAAAAAVVEQTFTRKSDKPATGSMQHAALSRQRAGEAAEITVVVDVLQLFAGLEIHTLNCQAET